MPAPEAPPYPVLSHAPSHVLTRLCAQAVPGFLAGDPALLYGQLALCSSTEHALGSLTLLSNASQCVCGADS